MKKRQGSPFFARGKEGGGTSFNYGRGEESVRDLGAPIIMGGASIVARKR